MARRGIRLNNPGNIRKGLLWQGMADIQNDPEFITFLEPEYGIRAMAKILLTYSNRYHISTIEGLITRYAPPSENDTEAYIKDVCTDSGFSRNQAIDLGDASTLTKILPAIIKHENGSQPYTAMQIALGVSRAVLK